MPRAATRTGLPLAFWGSQASFFATGRLARPGAVVSQLHQRAQKPFFATGRLVRPGAVVSQLHQRAQKPFFATGRLARPGAVVSQLRTACIVYSPNVPT